MATSTWTCNCLATWGEDACADRRRRGRVLSSRTGTPANQIWEDTDRERTTRTTIMSGTVIGSSIVIDGEVTGSDDVVVLGIVKGRVSVDAHVAVEREGTLEANVEALSVAVAGSVTGDIRAEESAELTPEARVTGDISASNVEIAKGASYRGSVDMTR